MYSTASFNSLMNILKKTPQKMLDYLQNNEKIVNRPFLSDASRLIYQDSVQKAQLLVNSNLF